MIASASNRYFSAVSNRLVTVCLSCGSSGRCLARLRLFDSFGRSDSMVKLGGSMRIRALLIACLIEKAVMSWESPMDAHLVRDWIYYHKL
jgi:hypothetical protein